MRINPHDRLFAAAALTPLVIDVLGLWPDQAVRIPVVILGTCGLIDGALRVVAYLASAIVGSPSTPSPSENRDVA